MQKGHLLAEGDDLWENPPVYRLNKKSPPDLDSLQKNTIPNRIVFFVLFGKSVRGIPEELFSMLKPW